jgi:hypothetical protein
MPPYIVGMVTFRTETCNKCKNPNPVSFTVRPEDAWKMVVLSRQRRKHPAWAKDDVTGRPVRKAPARHASMPSFMLHVGDFGTNDVAIATAHRVSTTSSWLSYAVLDRSQPGQVAVLQDESGLPTLVHLADTTAGAETWLAAHPHRLRNRHFNGDA